MGNILIGILFVVIGFVMALKANAFLNLFGRISWADEYLGPEGGTRLAYVVIGLFLILFGLTLMTGRMRGIFEAIFT